MLKEEVNSGEKNKVEELGKLYEKAQEGETKDEIKLLLEKEKYNLERIVSDYYMRKDSESEKCQKAIKHDKKVIDRINQIIGFGLIEDEK